VADEERRAARALLRRLSETPLGERLVLAGSSGLYTASDTIPALTEDLDFLVDADWAASHENLLLSEMENLGFVHVPGTCSFTRPDGASVDLVGYSTGDRVDRIGGGERLQIMVYADLSSVMADPGAIGTAAGGGRALTAAALAAVKLLTVRLEKGGKDKLQALLLIHENAGDEGFLSVLGRLLGSFERDRLEDAVGDAQAAFLALSSDPLRSDPQAAGYAGLRARLGEGLATLQRLLGFAGAVR
jgi:hypothetical protein